MNRRGDERDVLEGLERLEAWLEGDEEDEVIPIELLEQRGVTVPPAAELDETALHERLWSVIRAMAGIGMFLANTNHLSDRELYERLESAILREPAFLMPDDPFCGEHYDLAASESEEDLRIYLTYYADEEERQIFRRDFRMALPPALPPPYDRDRLLPQLGEPAGESQ
jgi:hypothetical protein